MVTTSVSQKTTRPRREPHVEDWCPDLKNSFSKHTLNNDLTARSQHPRIKQWIGCSLLQSNDHLVGPLRMIYPDPHMRTSYGVPLHPLRSADRLSKQPQHDWAFLDNPK